MNKIEFKQYLVNKQNHINQLLDELLPENNTSVLHQAIRYAVLNGGKRLRPLLTYATAETLGCDIDIIEPYACAIELIHSYSLIHDDLPSMDNDDLRRGKPTCHKVFGEAMAILAGDALQTYAFEILSTPSKNITPAQQIQMIDLLAKASGKTGMVYGQTLDIENNQNQTVEILNKINQLKTGALITAAVEIGIVLANCTDKKINTNLLTFSKNIGLAFQIQDDILDIESSTNMLGKSIGSDKKQHKKTYPEILGIAKSKEKVTQLYQTAMKDLSNSQLENSLLASLAEEMLNRKK